MEGAAARAPTSPALRSPSRCVGAATRVPRSTRRLTAVLAVLTGALAACDPYVQGSGVYRVEQRPDVGPFTGVRVESSVEATVTAGVPTPTVAVSGDANVVPYIETAVETDGDRRVLHVWVSKPFSGTIPPGVAIELPSLEHAAATGSSKILATKLAAPSLEVDADQGSSVILEGAATPGGARIEVRLGSGAALDATAYDVSGGAFVQLSGASSARLRCDGPVIGTVGGASQLDNLQGTGSCAAVVSDSTSKLSCR